MSGFPNAGRAAPAGAVKECDATGRTIAKRSARMSRPASLRRADGGGVAAGLAGGGAPEQREQCGSEAEGTILAVSDADLYDRMLNQSGAGAL